MLNNQKNIPLVLVCILISITLIVSAIFLRNSKSNEISNYISEVEALSIESKSIIIKGQSGSIILVKLTNDIKIVDENDLVSTFDQIKPGSILKISGFYDPDKKIISANLVKIGARPNIIIYKPIEGSILKDKLEIIGEARTLTKNLNIRIFDETNKKILEETVQLKNAGNLNYERFDKVYDKSSLKLKPGQNKITIELFQMSRLTNKEIDNIKINATLQ